MKAVTVLSVFVLFVLAVCTGAAVEPAKETLKEAAATFYSAGYPYAAYPYSAGMYPYRYGAYAYSGYPYSSYPYYY